MINHLSIKDFAVIENTSCDFFEGLNIITGETGAGKSVVIEGISLALGARADSSFIRSGCEKAIVQLAGELDGKEIIISREISSNGKNLCKLNGDIVTLSELKDTCQRLADIHGQYDNQFLLNPENHITFLDQYGKSVISNTKEKVSILYKSYSEIKSSLSNLVSNEREMRQKLDYYEYQLKDIDSLNLIPGEDAQLEEQISLMHNSEKIYQNLDSVYSNVYSDDSAALSTLFNALKDLESIAAYSKEVNEIKDTFSEACYTLQDLQNTLRSLRDGISFTPSELDNAISRYENIKDAKSKYGNTIEDILEYRAKINEALGNSIDFEHKKSKLTDDLAKAKQELMDAANELTNLRKSVALKLEEEIKHQLLELNFNNADIKIQFKTLSEPSPKGLDEIEILLSANKGENLKPLAKIASGGEMSRIMLAFKKIVSKDDSVPTLIFDEIDNGISGITASIVSKKLKEISREHQIICITHLPQIAACGDSNYHIVKTEDAKHTYTTIKKLTQEEKTQEIARLLGGTNITETTLASAKELIESSL